MVVEESAFRVDLGPQRPEIAGAWVERRDVFGAEEVKFAPVRPGAVLTQDRIDVLQIFPIVGAGLTGNRKRDRILLVEGLIQPVSPAVKRYSIG